ncbi:MAG: hypothetical protein ABI342_01675 [Nitrososphaera sp.]|jgi:hypothetical protein
MTGIVNEIDILKFDHWIKNNESDDNWITVAQHRQILFDTWQIRFGTSSAIVSKYDVPEILSNWDNLFDLHSLGRPSVWTTDQGKLVYADNAFVKKNNMKIEPFTFFRYWHSKSTHAKCELIQEFILFYNLFWNEKSKTWKTMTLEGKEYDVVKITSGDDNEKIEINTRFLRNYLAIRKRLLVRQHDHVTWVKSPLSNLLGKTHVQFDSSSANHNYHIALSEMHFDDYGTCSTLFGRDIILPYKKGQDLLGWKNGAHCKFIIGTDENGKNFECTCDEDKIGIQGNGKVHPLTTVFFKPEVLKKYYDNPSIYTVFPTDLHCSGLWSIPIDRNSKGLVYVHLGDLSHIPLDEQQHWKLYNVIPEGGMTESRWKRDFEAEFADPEDPVFILTKTLSEFQEKFKKRFGFVPFLPLNNADKSVHETLRIPLNNEDQEFEQQIGNLAKLLPDSIDIKSILEKLKQQNVNPKEIANLTGKIRSLEFFLKTNNVDTSLIVPLDTVQTLRTHGIAHRRTKDHDKIIKKLRLDEKNNLENFKVIIKQIIIGFEKF